MLGFCEQLVTNFSAISEVKRTPGNAQFSSLLCYDTCDESFLLFADEVTATTQFFALEFEKN